MPVDKHYKDIGLRIRILRESYKYTRDAFAEKIDISAKFLYEIEMGKKGFTVETLHRISNVLGVTNDYLITGDEGPKIPDTIMEFLENLTPEQLSHMEVMITAMQDLIYEPKEEYD